MIRIAFRQPSVDATVTAVNLDEDGQVVGFEMDHGCTLEQARLSNRKPLPGMTRQRYRHRRRILSTFRILDSKPGRYRDLGVNSYWRTGPVAIGLLQT